MRYHLAAAAVVFNAVAVDVQEDLTQVQLAAKDVPVRDALLLLTALHAHTRIGGGQLHDVGDIGLQTSQVNRLAHKLELAFPKFAGLQRIVDKRKQMPGRRPYLLVAFAQQDLVVAIAFANLQRPRMLFNGVLMSWLIR